MSEAFNKNYKNMQILKNRYFLFFLGIILASIMSILLAVSIQNVYGNVDTTTPAPNNSFEKYTFFATSTNQVAEYSFGTSTNATSTNITQWVDSNGRVDKGYFVIAGAKKVEFYFGRGATTTQNDGTVGYRVQVTPDGSNWYDFSKLVLSTTTTKTTYSKVFQQTGTTTVPVALDLQDDSFYAVRCIANYLYASTDGKIFCSATAQF